MFTHAAFSTQEPPLPQHAVVLYRQSQGPFEHPAMVPMLHPVTVCQGMPTLEAGRTMTLPDARALLRTLIEDRDVGRLAWNDPTIIAQGDHTLAWMVPGKVRPMWFRRPKGEPLALNVPWPTLVFLAGDGQISLAALASNRRPNPKTRLYRPPLMNTYSDGLVCLGSAQVGAMDGPESRPAFEAAIFDSLFSHGNHRDNLRLPNQGDPTHTDAQHIAFYRRLAKAKAKRFPREALVPMGCTLGRFLGLEGER